VLLGEFRRHRHQTISPIAIDVIDPWSVCHVRALCSNGRRYRQDFFLHTTLRASPRSC